MPIDLNARGIEPDLKGFETMLQNLQGNILKGHGRDHTVNILFELKPITDERRSKLIELVSSLVTSAWTQAVETGQFKQVRIPGRMFGNFFLTAKGYRALGFTQDQIDQSFQEKPDELGTLSNFKEGMQAHRDELNDPDPSTWDAGFRERA